MDSEEIEEKGYGIMECPEKLGKRAKCFLTLTVAENWESVGSNSSWKKGGGHVIALKLEK